MDALIFDYDGVIADTEPLHWRSWAELLADFGFSLGWDEYLELGRGVNDVRFLQALSKKVKSNEFPLGILKENERRRKRVLELSLAVSPIPKETVSMLRSLAPRWLGLVSSSNRREVEPVLRANGIDKCFRACVFGDDVHRHKPDPEPYLLAAKLLGTSVGFVFEDSRAGIESAKSAGFQTIEVSHPISLPALVDQTIKGKRLST